MHCCSKAQKTECSKNMASYTKNWRAQFVFSRHEKMSFQKENIFLTVVVKLRLNSTKELFKTVMKNKIAEYFVDKNDLMQINPSIYQEILAIVVENRKFISFEVKTNFDSK